jgi:lipopolysaccharide heptosyltransferase III
LVFLAGLLRRRRKPVAEISTLGLLQTAAIGDTVLMAGVIEDLRKALPKTRILLLAGPSSYEMSQMLEGLDKVIEIPINNPWQATRMIRAERLDVLCDFGPWPRINALLAWMSGARYTLGFRTDGQYRHYAYDCAVEHRATVHEVENFQDLCRPLGVRSESPPRLKVAAPLWGGLKPGKYAVFHAWAGGYRGHLREWPNACWTQLAEKVTARGLQVVLTGAPSDVEKNRQLADMLSIASPGRVTNLAGKLGLAQTARLLKDSAFLVTVNTGVMHIGAAVDARVIALNGPTSAVRWGPLGSRSISVNSRASGCGFLNLGFEYENQRLDCMELIPPAEVMEAVKRVLGQNPVESAS